MCFFELENKKTNKTYLYDTDFLRLDGRPVAPDIRILKQLFSISFNCFSIKSFALAKVLLNN